MKKFAFFLSLMVVLFCLACSDNDHDETTGKPGEGPGVINLAVTSRVGTHVGDDLTAYVKSLDLLLFRENTNGIYLLRESVSFTKAQLEALAGGTTEVSAGFTEARNVNFDNLPIGNYIIVGVGNMRDSVGGALENAALSAINVGNTMQEIVASVTEGSTSPRIFFGMTDRIVLGSAMPVAPSLTLYRKVAMFALTLQNVPAAVDRIDVEVQNTYGAFNMTGNFLSDRVISVTQSNRYEFTEDQSTLPLALVTLPTVTGEQSAFTLLFYLDNGQVITIPLQNTYVLKANTITKLTATIDADQSGGVWNVRLTLSISADVEWNVDQEPNIII
ncbi:FimB/Mfa2 family fimbrial subunit [Odoribacter laneus]|uniref:FimB/Mfa2 family fimbrial subunit n=1 Tax=Odoribacter laneus TaxID=626933 RepID=UPI0023F14E44|nr:FimB/Mfa2 family fimbrial subunit [Odoribacter laneus]